MKELIRQLFYFEETAGLAQNIVIVVSAALMVVLGIGCIILSRWLVNTRFGAEALKDAPPRENRLTPWPVLLIFLMWSFLTLAISEFAAFFMPGEPTPAEELGGAVISSTIASAFTVVCSLFLAKKVFANGLKGFGVTFDSKKALREEIGGLKMFLAIWPLTIIVYNAINLICVMIMGEDFQMPRHDYLASLSEDPSAWVLIAIFFSAVYVAPVTEEIIFRGFLQTLLQKLTPSRWLSIFITSVLFAMIHGGDMLLHWPTLIVLSMGIGYAYEKTGSMRYPVAIHAAFNFVNLVIAIMDIV
ncbi:CAAX prenyl protease-related protein [Limihaloglobus sulfuriphilus]|uniref:CAAX prenyl protease-related protein n=1 Tax=Limihaloglobus sulfuriphilus TaxID=1851148 RepID=A0A1Q2MGV4_9BACT|nr:CPBP family intramembrane glutamic endopeptidase [Limihaloglobus sulfuriphilus]AQQ71935.1 CAAX prenyl protease-related protein [Limihaloglobus sulfuriphilus]